MHPLWDPPNTSEVKLPENWLWPLAVLTFVVNALLVVSFLYLS